MFSWNYKGITNNQMVKIQPFSPVFLSAGPMPEAFGVILLELQENISQSL